jgi:microcystin-dependent protein
MTYDEIVSTICARLNLSAVAAQARVGDEVNQVYKKVTSAIGLQVARNATVVATASLGDPQLTFSGIEKVGRVDDRSSGGHRFLRELTKDEIQDRPSTTGSPSAYALYRMGPGSVTVLLDCTPQAAFDLYADGQETAATLFGAQEPAFPESFHDILIEGVLALELKKMEKIALAQMAKGEYEERLSDLRMWIAKSGYLTIHQGKTSHGVCAAPSGSTSGTAAPSGGTSYIQTGLITFDRDPDAPFAVSGGSATVPNLDADLLDGQQGAAYHDASQLTGSLPAISGANLTGVRKTSVAIVESDIALTDVATDNVSSAAHGLAPRSPADATTFLNGAATPAYATVKDSDLTTSDVTTNNVSTTKHGFVPKAPNDTTQVLRGDGVWGTSSPTGAITMFGGAAAPTGWLICDGSAASRSGQAALFGIIGTTYGVGDGSTTFNVPDLRQRFPLGKAATGTGSSLGSTGGVIDHTHGSAAHTHTTPDLSLGLGHSLIANTLALDNLGSRLGFWDGSSFFVPNVGSIAATIGSSAYGVAASTTGSTTPGATGTANPPFVTVNFIIKT